MGRGTGVASWRRSPGRGRWGSLTIVVNGSEGRSVVPAWGRFLLRLTAIGLPFLTTWLAGDGDPSQIGAVIATLLVVLVVPWGLPVTPTLMVLGMVALICSVNMVGTRQRYALAVAAVLVAATVVAALCGAPFLSWPWEFWPGD